MSKLATKEVSRRKARAILDSAWRLAEELRKEADPQYANARLKAKEFLKEAKKKFTRQNSWLKK
jgi:hypothetical protein